MTNLEILTKAIEKATTKGFISPDWVQGPEHFARGLLSLGSTFSLIFNHDFAKALWGIDWKGFGPNLKKYVDNNVGYTPWEFHLRNMVIAPDPIKYLGEHLDD